MNNMPVLKNKVHVRVQGRITFRIVTVSYHMAMKKKSCANMALDLDMALDLALDNRFGCSLTVICVMQPLLSVSEAKSALSERPQL